MIAAMKEMEFPQFVEPLSGTLEGGNDIIMWKCSGGGIDGIVEGLVM